MLGYVLITERGGTEALFAQILPDMRNAGLSIAGAVQDAADPDDMRSDMTLTMLNDGQRIKISQDLGPQATGCRLDTNALETAVGLTCDQLRTGHHDLLLVNKFGKQEAAGEGFVQAIGLAFDADIPVLIAVPSRFATLFLDWSGGMGAELTTDTALRWALDSAR